MHCNRTKCEKGQSGFSLIELIIGLVVVGILSLAMTRVISQLLIIDAESGNRSLVVRQVQNVGYWISRDAVSARAITADNDPDSPEFLNIQWNDWDGTDFEADYYFDEGRLYRSYLINGVQSSDSLVGEHIDAANTTCVESGSVWTLTVTATVGGFPRPATETRTYEVMPRPPSM